jgi:hypothetical protein
MTDFEGWMELCDLYLSQLDYSKACYCMEELIMSNPHNHLFYQKFAEVRNIMKNKKIPHCLYRSKSNSPHDIADKLLCWH